VNNQVTVVFDGHPDHFSSTPQGEIRVIFSDGCSADDKIKQMVEEMPAKKNCVVVSDDKDIFLYARSLGARIMSVTAFVSKGGKYISCSEGKNRARNPGISSNSREAEAGLSLSQQEKINKELFQKWLGEKQ
jgi:predicted RNA-binding protein with PIN domain